MSRQGLIVAQGENGPRNLWLFWDFNTYISWPEDLVAAYRRKLIIREEYEWRKEWEGITKGNHGCYEEFLECMKIMDWIGNKWLDDTLDPEMDLTDPDEDRYPEELRPLVRKYPKFIDYLCLRYFG